MQKTPPIDNNKAEVGASQGSQGSNTSARASRHPDPHDLFLEWTQLRADSTYPDPEDDPRVKRAVETILSRLNSALVSSAHSTAYVFYSADADDLAQAARLALVEALHKYDPTNPSAASFTTYAISVIEGTLHAEGCRACEKRTEALLPETPIDGEAIDCYPDVDRRIVLDAALEQLPPQWRRIVRARFYLQHTLDEIATVEGYRHHEEIRRILARALEKLKEFLGGDAATLLAG